MADILKTMRRAFAAPRAPEIVLGLGMALVAVYAARTGVRVSEFALDEAVIKQQAVNYTSGLPHSLFHDVAARGPSRFYSLVQSPVFRIWSGDDAVRHAKALNAALFASTAVPVWLLAKRFLDGRWAPALVGLLAIACPWLALTTVVFTENLSYPLFAWTLLAMVWCLERPSWRRDLVVIVFAALLTVTRVQLFTVLLLWPAALIAIDLFAPDRAGTLKERAAATTARLFKKHPVTIGVLGLGVLYVLWLAAHHTLRAKFTSGLGDYSEIGYRTTVPADYFESLLAEVVQFAAGLGVLPAIAALVYWLRSLTDRSDPRWRTTMLVVFIGVGTTLATLFAQGGYLYYSTEERYYIYLVPLAWIGAFGLLGLKSVKTSWLVSVSGVIVLLFAAVPILTPLTTEYVILASGGSTVGHIVRNLGAHIGQISERDGLALIGFVVSTVAIWVWVRRPQWRVAWIAVPAVFQLTLTLFVFSVIDGDTKGVPSRTGGDFNSLSFVDRNAGDGPVTWLDAQRKSNDLSAEGRQRAVLFWNQKISGVVFDPGIGLPPVSFPLSSVALAPIEFDPVSGLARSGLPLEQVVLPTESPFLQLAIDRVIARSAPGDLALVRPAKPARAIWRVTGLPNTGTLADPPARLRAWGSGRLEVQLDFLPAPRVDGGLSTTAAVRVGFGGKVTTASFGAARTLTVSGCAAPGKPINGTATRLTGQPQLVAVRVRRVGAC